MSRVRKGAYRGRPKTIIRSRTSRGAVAVQMPKLAVLLTVLVCAGCAATGSPGASGVMPADFATHLSPDNGWSLFRMPTANALPNVLALGSDGNLWFTEIGHNYNGIAAAIGKITPTGSVTEYRVPQQSGSNTPYSITPGAPGELWFTFASGYANNTYIGRITTAGVVSLLSVPTTHCSSIVSGSIAYGSDGNVWFADPCGHDIIRMTPTGATTAFGVRGSSPWAIVSGPDGNIWWIDNVSGIVGEMTTAGSIKKFEHVASAYHLYAIANGPNGKIYVLESRCNVSQEGIAELTTTGKFTEFPMPNNYCNLALAAGPDKKIWIVGDVLHKFDPTTHKVSAPISFPGTFGFDVFSIAQGSDKKMWMSQTFHYNRILRFN
jgi:streptogramin lyase